MNKLNKLYEAMLKSWGCVITPEGAITLNFAGTEVPVKVDDKQTFLPTSENLNGVTIGKVFFHPACESIMSKETEIFKVIRKLTAAKIYAVFQPVCEVMFSVASKKSGKTLTGKMLEQLEPFKVVTKAVKQEVIDIVKTISITIEDSGIDTRLINFSMIKGGKTENDEAIYYTATPSFPFYTELYRTISQNEHLKPGDRLSFNGLSVTVQALRTVIALFETALPACIDPSRKKYSATSQDAARMVAYLHSYGLVVSDLNSLIGKFRKEFDSIGVYSIDLDWLADLDEISDIKKLVPSLDYNNYNITSAPEATAANSGARISSYNPLAGVINTTSSPVPNQGSAAPANIPANAPKTPDAQPGESYLGCEYNPVNGIYEFKYQTNTGYVRVRRLSEDGRFISEDFQTPIQNNGMNMGMGQPNIMNPALLAQLMASGAMGNNGMMGSGIPLYGMGPNAGGNGGMVRDPYSGAWVPANGNNGNNGNNAGAWGNNNGNNNNGYVNNGGFDMPGTGNINGY